MSLEEKVPHMIDWWHKAHCLIIETNLNQSMIRDLVNQSKMELKKGVQQFITELLRSETPILIFSAGLGDVIELFFEKEIPEFKHNHESSHIVSNFIQYGSDGQLISFNDKVIHSFNKNEHEIHDTPYYQSILNRPNVILLGDMLGDVGMIGGMKNLKQILKIGYLNRSTPEKLEVYKRIYDIVICDDPTFDVPNAILNAIL
jgi:5'-nucleotidase